MSKRILKESIKRMVREAIAEMHIYNRLNEESSIVGSKKSFITATLNKNDKDKFDHAHLAYKLWPDMDKDTARSYFSKCVRGERNFSDEEITKLFNMLRK